MAPRPSASSACEFESSSNIAPGARRTCWNDPGDDGASTCQQVQVGTIASTGSLRIEDGSRPPEPSYPQMTAAEYGPKAVPYFTGYEVLAWGLEVRLTVGLTKSYACLLSAASIALLARLGDSGTLR